MVCCCGFLPRGRVREDVFHRPVARDTGLCQPRVWQTGIRLLKRRPRLVKPFQKLLSIPCRRLSLISFDLNHTEQIVIWVCQHDKVIARSMPPRIASRPYLH